MSDKGRTMAEIDEFWSLEKLLPEKKKTEYRRQNTDTEAVEIDLFSDVEKTEGSKIPPSGTSVRNMARQMRERNMRTKAQAEQPEIPEPYLVYEPENGAIKKVSVSKWRTKYRFYEKFASDMRRYWDKSGSECEQASFFSYIPQYNQLNYKQMKWYLYFRECVRNNKYPDTDFSYILLYLYEIINSDDLIEADKGVELLCNIWLNYRNRYPRIDSYLTEWLCDYCLIHKLPCPVRRLETIIRPISVLASFKEFYLSDGEPVSLCEMLAYNSDYDWRRSRYLTKENSGIFKTHITNAFAKAYEKFISDSGGELSVSKAQIKRDAYANALCVYSEKRLITVEYLTCTRQTKYKFPATEIIKYSENRVRAALGIKPKLKADFLPKEIKDCIDGYFAMNLPPKEKCPPKSKKNVTGQENYDKLYEPAKREFSLEHALEIENESWKTTEILTNAFDGDEMPEPEEIKLPEPEQNTVEEPFALLIKKLSPLSQKALLELSEGKCGAIEKNARENGILPDALAEEINELAFDITGDSVLETDGNYYTIIEDYKEDIIKGKI